jgi:hypothetical protein
MNYKEMFQTYLLKAATLSNERLEYLINTYVEELESFTENLHCFDQEWLDALDYYINEAAKLTSISEEQFVGLGAIVSKCNRDDLVYVIWPDKQEVSICLNFGGNTTKLLAEFGKTFSISNGNEYIKIPFRELSSHVLTY